MTRLQQCIATAGLVVAVAACSSGIKQSQAPTTTTASPTTRPTTTPVIRECQPAPGYAPGTTAHRLTVAGVDREFLVHMPPTPIQGMRLVVDFHGAGSNMQQQDFYSGFNTVADREGFVVATPNGVDGAIRQWRFLGTPDDVTFAKEIVRTLARDACVDAAHVLATGISSGGAMTASLACQASDTFTAFGPVAADFYLPAICDRAEQRPIIIFHGTDDALVPYNGGSVATGRGLGVAPAETTAAAWAKHNRCAAGPIRKQLGSEVVRLTWDGCAAPVVMYRIEGGGHTWPGAAIDVARLGLTTKQVRATDAMWKFFQEHG